MNKKQTKRGRRRGRNEHQPATGKRSSRHAFLPDILYHATDAELVERVKRKGVLSVARGKNVFLSSTEDHAWHIAHRNNLRPEVLYIDVTRARRKGCEFRKNRHGLWEVKSIPIRYILNLHKGFDVQVSAGGIPVWQSSEGPRLALIRVKRARSVKWELAKGKLEPGENPASAAMREIQEEMGCTMELTNQHSLGFVRFGFFTPKGKPRLKTLHLYLFDCPEIPKDDFHPAHDEGILEVKWFTPKEAVQVISHRSLKPLIRKVQRMLSMEPGSNPKPLQSLELTGA